MFDMVCHLHLIQSFKKLIIINKTKELMNCVHVQKIPKLSCKLTLHDMHNGNVIPVDQPRAPIIMADHLREQLELKLRIRTVTQTQGGAQSIYTR